MNSQKTIDAIKEKYDALKFELDEKSRRIWAAAEAESLGHGGTVAVSKATGIAESTIRIGRHEINNKFSRKKRNDTRRIRNNGGGRKRLSLKDKDLIVRLESLVDPSSRGDPTSPLRWTSKSTRRLAKELSEMGHPVSHAKVGQLLAELGYSLQSTRKRMEGSSHPDRDAQFKYINSQVIEFQKGGQPIISVDTKKKELIGKFSNAGKEYQPKGKPEEVEAYDFPKLSDGKGIPYGVYDISQNEGWVSVGVDHDTAQFAANTILLWWLQMGKTAYPEAKELLITADGGGSNGVRNRLWKKELQSLADKTMLKITVCHFPPGTSKWNKIEHRLFSHITKNWRGKPLASHEVVVNLIANTTTDAGLKINATLDSKKYPTGIKVTDEEMGELNLEKNDFHGEWNYTILPS